MKQSGEYTVYNGWFRARGIYRHLAMFAVCFLLCFSTTNAQDEAAAKREKVKAAYLYNFIKFVEWPEAHSPAVSHKVGICIMGGNPFGSSLDALKAGLSGKMDVHIMNDVSMNEVGECHVLFITSPESVNLPAVLATARKNAILTVSEDTDFIERGGIIEMKTVEKSVGLFSSNKINLRINMKAAEASELRMNAQLLEIAAEVIK